MNFYKEIGKEFGEIGYMRPHISRYEEFKSKVENIIFDNKKVLIYGDYDPDGMMCVCVWKNAFLKLNYENFDIVPYTSRTHDIDEMAVSTAITGKYDVLLINDAGSNSYETLKELSNAGIEVILLDHHQSSYTYEDYPENVFVINTTMENKINETQLTLSAGALTYVLLDAVLEDNGVIYPELAVFALLSLYSDSIDMYNDLNRGIYYRVKALKNGVPREIGCFLNDYQIICRRFFEFHMVPKLNSAFRSENFEPLNEGYMCKGVANKEYLSEMVETLTEMHASSKEMVGTISDIIQVEEWNNFVIGYLNSVNEHISVEQNRLYNYTGLVANKLSEKYNKSSVVYCVTKGKVKGSFRDHCGRNYLSIFQKFCMAGGHNSAFGITMDFFDVADFLNSLRIVDSDFEQQGVNNKPIVVSDMLVPDRYVLEDMAQYNEFAGVTKPLALVSLRRDIRMQEVRTRFGTFIYRWGDVPIGSTRRIHEDEMMELRPTVGRNMKLNLV